jgi:transcriptional regulator GlxA family with amidase domain
MKQVTILALPRSLGSSITLPVEMLNAAFELAKSRDRHQSALQIDIAGDQAGPVSTAGGLTLYANKATTEINETDLLILPALWRNPVQALRRQSHLLPLIQRLAAQGSLLCAVGTSSYFLAEANLLDYKPATTHWRYLDQFAKRYAKVDLKREYLITQAENLYCAGSVNSVADLMVHIVERFYGQDIARLVEAQFSPEIRRPFASHAYAQFNNNIHQDETIIQAQEWLREHSGASVSVKSLAQELGLTMRTFNRRFKQATGITATDYLQNQRLNNAKELLRTSNLAIAEVAEQCGYQDVSYFCSRFKRVMGQSPLFYRKSVRGKLFQVI